MNFEQLSQSFALRFILSLHFGHFFESPKVNIQVPSSAVPHVLRTLEHRVALYR